MIEVIVIRFGGIIVPELSNCVHNVFESTKKSSADSLIRDKENSIYNEIKKGEIDIEKFSHQFANQRITNDSKSFQNLLLDNAKCINGIKTFLLSLINYCSLVVVVDYPEDLFRKVSEKCDLSGFFSMCEVIFLGKKKTDLSNPSEVRELYQAYPEYLVLEPNCARALKYVSEGIQTIHFTDIFRTARELQLRKIIPDDFFNRLNLERM